MSMDNKMLMDLLSPKARAHALGVQVVWTFPEQGIDPDRFHEAIRSHGLPMSLLDGLQESTANQAFGVAMKYVRGNVRRGDRKRKISSVHLSKPSEKKNGVSAKFSTYAMNIAQVETEKHNGLIQAGVISLNTDSGEVEFEYMPGLCPEDYVAIDSMVEKIEAKVVAWTNKYSRESLNRFFTQLISRSNGFYWVIRGNSWFVPNPEFGKNRQQLSIDNPIEQLVGVSRAVKELNPRNIIQITPIFPDPCDDSLSPHLELKKSAKRVMELRLKSETEKLRKLLVRDDQLKGNHLTTRRNKLDDLRAQADLYARILGAEIKEITDQVSQAEKLISLRERQDLGLEDDTLSTLW